MKHEAFVYLWYDAPNKKYYLGKHKGTPDDSYTHSSTIWEHFTKDNIPEGVTRRILAYGTHEEMCVLEHNLLVNRKKRCWDRYHNNSLGDPRYVDTSGENHPNWKGGRNGTWRKAYVREWQRNACRAWSPERKAKYKEYQKEYGQRPESKEARKKYIQRSEYKAWRKKYDAERYIRKKLERQGTGTLEAFMGFADTLKKG